MDETTLILDLDDTIFKTRSLDPKPFQAFFDRLQFNLRKETSQEKVDLVLEEIWQRPWDSVITRHGLPMEPLLDAISVLETLKLDLTIAPYPDYVFLKNLNCPKFLVTTSLTSLQEIKIKALNIEQDFEKIFINDTFKRKETKLSIFKDLSITYGLNPARTFVIGDNASSEIAAGNALNFKTVQILREGVEKGVNANYYIHSFEELEQILNTEPSA
ncbi:hypothetical protein CNR22_04380 [Sphingobacteriaceae bacterium]|nr:hypothetical protein CNR22_04380 [Sphingobacteriaceae bacterium]